MEFTAQLVNLFDVSQGTMSTELNAISQHLETS